VTEGDAPAERAGEGGGVALMQDEAVPEPLGVGVGVGAPVGEPLPVPVCVPLPL
jgi:hypothetical protein